MPAKRKRKAAPAKPAAKRKRAAKPKRKRARRYALQSFCERADDYCPTGAGRYGIYTMARRSPLSGIVDGSGPLFMAIIGAALLWAKNDATQQQGQLKPPAKATTPTTQQTLPGVMP